jgi:hypothetical protein
VATGPNIRSNPGPNRLAEHSAIPGIIAQHVARDAGSGHGAKPIELGKLVEPVEPTAEPVAAVVKPKRQRKPKVDKPAKPAAQPRPRQQSPTEGKCAELLATVERGLADGS